MDWEYHSNVVELLNRLKNEGWKLVSLEQVEGSISLSDFSPNLSDKYAFILGNEVFGVKQEIIEMSDFVLEIPQFGTKHSFNVSVSNGIVLWDFYSKTK